MPTSNYAARVERVRQEMRAQEIDLLIITPSTDFLYLTGRQMQSGERLLAFVLPAEGEPFLIANALLQLQLTALPFQDVVIWNDIENPVLLLADAVRERGFVHRRIALENQMIATFSMAIAQAFPGASLSLVGEVLGRLRRQKTAEEIAIIAAASRIAENALKQVFDQGGYWIGKTESDFAEALTALLREQGVQTHPIVAVGANAAEPHHRTDNTVIERGKCLLVDFVGRYQDYYTDMTRTIHFGQPNAEFKKVYQLVREAELAGEEAAKVGALLGDVDLAARRHIEQSGYGAYFTHRTGHGIGLDVHEEPYAVQGNKTPIEPGMVFSVEPGIYLPGSFGVRIEDLVAVGASRGESLHHLTKELWIIDS